MESLNEKIKLTKKVIVKTRRLFPVEKTVVTWKGAKDSTVLLHIIKTIYGEVPFPVMFNDTTMEFPEVYEFIRKVTNEWNLKLSVIRHNPKMLEKFNKAKNQSMKAELSRLMKIDTIHTFQKIHKIEAFIVGIRRDENPARAQETLFSKRDTHIRVHPILDFTEKDIWDYIHKFDVPYCSLYDQGYRSLGEMPFTQKAVDGKGERSGREPKKEALMEKLRGMGYW